MQSKCSALETKNNEIVSHQHTGCAGSSAALTGLHTRLDSLVEQLVSTYSISDQDLEVNYFFLPSQASSLSPKFSVKICLVPDFW